MKVGKLRGAMVAVSILAGAVPAVAIARPVGDSASLQEYVERYQSVWNTHDPAAVAAFFSEIRMMSDDVALLNLAATGAALDAKAAPAPVRTARATWVLVREDGRWLIDALRVLPSEQDRVIRDSSRQPSSGTAEIDGKCCNERLN